MATPGFSSVKRRHTIQYTLTHDSSTDENIPAEPPHFAMCDNAAFIANFSGPNGDAVKIVEPALGILVSRADLDRGSTPGMKVRVQSVSLTALHSTTPPLPSGR